MQNRTQNTQTQIKISMEKQLNYMGSRPERDLINDLARYQAVRFMRLFGGPSSCKSLTHSDLKIVLHLLCKFRTELRQRVHILSRLNPLTIFFAQMAS